MRIYVTAATGALRSAEYPVGGGVAVLEALLPYLAAQPGWQVTVLRAAPAEGVTLAGALTLHSLSVPALKDCPPAELLTLGEGDYAAFAAQWEERLGRYFRGLQPRGAVVLANDIGEGPPFARLAADGFAVVPIYHVLVVDFLAQTYLRGLPSSAAVAALWRRLESSGLHRYAPRLLRLAFEKERQSVEVAQRLIVPSPGLADAVRACYPGTGVVRKLAVVPWGVLESPSQELPSRQACRARWGVEEGELLLVTLSRLSPEKRIEAALEALRLLERRRPTGSRVRLLVAGAPAYMGGRGYERRLRRAAARLTPGRVRFVGYVEGARKWGLLRAADLLLSPSRYEAYGLSIAQALAAGTPVLAADHYGARACLTDETGQIIAGSGTALARGLAAAIEGAAADAGVLAFRRKAAEAWAADHPFELAARRVVQLLAETATP